MDERVISLVPKLKGYYNVLKCGGDNIAVEGHKPCGFLLSESVKGKIASGAPIDDCDLSFEGTNRCSVTS